VPGNGQDGQTRFRRWHVEPGLVAEPVKSQDPPSALCQKQPDGRGVQLFGGIQETQEMLNFCGKHHITSDIEVIPIQKVNEAYDRLIKNDVRYRFVIDISSLR
jgi:D-arabinose 1-dehydrogenase-like Zn-dependent alcohol dehydrogenase